MKEQQLTKQIEAILIIENEHRSIESLAKQLEVTQHDVEQCIEQLSDMYKKNDHGIEIIRSSRGVLLVPESEVWDTIAPHYHLQHDSPLSRPVIETLAIIAYSQPVTIAEIEKLRGLSTGYNIRLLLERKLIVSVGTKKAPGRPRLYGTTKQFLHLYNLNTIKELPVLSENDAVLFLSSSRKQRVTTPPRDI